MDLHLTVTMIYHPKVTFNTDELGVTWLKVVIFELGLSELSETSMLSQMFFT